MKCSRALRNIYLTASKSTQPRTVVRSAEWNDPERVVAYKTLYFTLGLSSQPIRRAALINIDNIRMRTVPRDFNPDGSLDPTGFRRARYAQLKTWKHRIQYQEWYLQHAITRYLWGVLRMYPPGGAKIPVVYERSYFGYDRVAHNRYSREPLPAMAAELYPRRQ